MLVSLFVTFLKLYPFIIALKTAIAGYFDRMLHTRGLTDKRKRSIKKLKTARVNFGFRFNLDTSLTRNY